MVACSSDDSKNGVRVRQNLDCLRRGEGVYIQPFKRRRCAAWPRHNLEQLRLDAGQDDIVVIAQLVAGPPNFQDLAGKIPPVFGKAGDKIGGQGGDVRLSGPGFQRLAPPFPAAGGSAPGGL
jgi:hypothetical protein